MSELVGKFKDRFSHDAVHLKRDLHIGPNTQGHFISIVVKNVKIMLHVCNKVLSNIHI